MSFEFSEFPVCGLTYSLTPALPFVAFDPNAKKIEVYSEDLEDAGLYNMILKAAPIIGVQQTV
jgi:hypothetical protein